MKPKFTPMSCHEAHVYPHELSVEVQALAKVLLRIRSIVSGSVYVGADSSRQARD